MIAAAKALRPIWGNPVVVRDLRVRMRGARSYWNQAGYLMLLGLISVAGYSTAVTRYPYEVGGGFDPIRVQAQLHDFYTFIFMALAGLITLIAPALTAASMTSERQNLTLDMLITTPLSAAELLFGKLVSCVAFITLLLILSLPASALCVMLGGATIGDVFRVYVIIAVDGLLMAAIGLYFSCAIRHSLPAIMATYATVGVMLIAPLGVFAMTSMMRGGYMGHTPKVPAIICVAMLNPFLAVSEGGSLSFSVGSYSIPIWVGVIAVAALLIRLLVTAAGFRLGAYGPRVVPSLRRQVLLITVIGAALLANLGAILTPGMGGVSRTASPVMPVLLAFMSIAAAALFLPALFVPVAAEDAAPGTPVKGWYRIGSAFRAEHAGSLPFFHLYLLAFACGVFIGYPLPGGAGNPLSLWLESLYWVSGIGYLCWGFARFASGLVHGATGGRALGFGLEALAVSIPMALAALLIDSSKRLEDYPLMYLWILYPLMQLTDPQTPSYLLWSGSLCYGVGTILSPFWSKVVPGGWRKERRVHAT